MRPAFLSTTHPAGVAVSEGHIYWTNSDSNTIGRATLDGSDVQDQFIVTGDNPAGLAVREQHIYWSNYYDGTAARASMARRSTSISSPAPWIR